MTLAFFPPSSSADAGATAGVDAKKFVLSVTPTGVASDGVCPADAVDLGDPRCDLRWESHARTGTDFDGTINKLGDFDEEWAVEVALPLASIGLAADGPSPGRVAATIRRCEMAHDGPRACGLWGSPQRPGELVLDNR